jgi:hypothetical protein
MHLGRAEGFPPWESLLKQKPRGSHHSHGADLGARSCSSGDSIPPGVSFGSIQRSIPRLPTAGDSHIRQSLNPAMPAPPVGPSPGFRAVACVCMVTSPNEVKTVSGPCSSSKTYLGMVPIFLLRAAGWFVKQKHSRKGNFRRSPTLSDAPSALGQDMFALGTPSTLRALPPKRNRKVPALQGF